MAAFPDFPNCRRLPTLQLRFEFDGLSRRFYDTHVEIYPSFYQRHGRLLAATGLIILGLLLGSRSEAQLTWDTRRIELRATLQDTHAVAVFAFTNATSQAIVIHEAKVSCGACTTVELPKKQYLPGEAGSLKIIYSFGSRVGPHDATVLVRTDSLVESTVVLNLRVHIPEVFQIRPSFVCWRVGEKPVGKEISIKVVHDSPIHLLGVKAEGEAFQAESRIVEEGKEYVVTITPKDTKVPVMARVFLETDLVLDPKKEFKIHAMVRGGGPPFPMRRP